MWFLRFSFIGLAWPLYDILSNFHFEPKIRENFKLSRVVLIKKSVQCLIWALQKYVPRTGDRGMPKNWHECEKEGKELSRRVILTQKNHFVMNHHHFQEENSSYTFFL